MASKFVIFALLITSALAQAREISNAGNNTITKIESEGRTLEIPIIGTFLLIAFKIGGLVVSSALSLLEYKLTALSLLSSWVSWAIQNYFLVIVGTAAVLGLCFMTSAFSSYPVYEEDQILIQAARNLDHGIVKYARLI